MNVLFKSKIRQKTTTVSSELFAHLLPSLFAIFFYELISIEVYLHASLKSTSDVAAHSLTPYKLFTWITTQAIGGLVLGYLSDKFCRKKMLLFTLLCGIIFLPFLFWQGFTVWWIGVLGIGFSPSPIARAALVDNFPFESKVKLMSWTFVAQFVPWVFYLWIGIIDLELIFWISWIGVMVVCGLSKLFFEDKRDMKQKDHDISIKDLVHRDRRRKVTITLTALFSAQIVFFLTDSYFEEFSSNGGLYSALGFGSLIGAIMALFYKKTPHISMITTMYGAGFLISIMPVASIVFFNIEGVNVRYQLMVFSNLGGFYLPFIYDIILSNLSSKVRGTACGVIDLVISLSSLIGLSTILFINPNELTVVLLTTILFLIALIIQKQGESDEKPKKHTASS